MVFGGAPENPVARFFRRGFQHCFVCLETAGGWVLYDPLSCGTEINVLVGIPTGVSDGIDHVERFYRTQEYSCVRTKTSSLKRRALSPALFTCVEAVKRVLGIRAWKVFTPFQLFKYLERQEDGKTRS